SGAAERRSIGETVGDSFFSFKLVAPVSGNRDKLLTHSPFAIPEIGARAMFERFHGLLLVHFPCVLGAGESSSGRNFGSCGINVPDLLNSEEMAASHMAVSREIGRGVRRSHEKPNQSGGDVVEVTDMLVAPGAIRRSDSLGHQPSLEQLKVG